MEEKLYQEFLSEWNAGLNKLSTPPREIFNWFYIKFNTPETVDKRHYCVKCSSKRHEQFMKIEERKLHRTTWECIDCLTNKKL